MPDSSDESKFAGAVTRLIICCKGFTVALVAALTVASAQTASEYQVKAAYLYNFAKATQWPEALPAPDSPLVIGVFGGDEDFVKLLHNTLAGKTVTGHPIEIRHSRSLVDLKSCQMVFFRASEKEAVPMITALNSSGVLLVGEDTNFLAQGGMINLSLKDGRVTFEVNPESIEHAGVHYGQSSLAPAKTGDSTIESAGSRPVKNEVSPTYPDIAKNMSLKGTVQLQALVRADGTVKEVHVLGGHPMLAAAAQDAVMKWKYQPEGKETLETVRITFGAN